MKYVMKIHVECESSEKAGDLEQMFHLALDTISDRGEVKIDPENTFVVAIGYSEYHSRTED